VLPSTGEPSLEAPEAPLIAPEAQPDEPTTLVVDYSGDEHGMGELLTLLVSNGVAISRFAEQSSDLEDIFMQVTKGIVQ
ncbi:MAG TPA: hypothetical protein VFX76_06970, partial [Roseiflexaceae bacterium]|nr:hypothetical protein [Roseiflexaceae bacterium]